MMLFITSCSVPRKFSQNFYFGHYSEGEKYYNEGKYDKAIEEYRAYIEEDPEGNMAVIAKYYMGKSYLAQGETSAAREIFKSIVADYPDLIWANFSKTQLQELESPAA